MTGHSAAATSGSSPRMDQSDLPPSNRTNGAPHQSVTQRMFQQISHCWGRATKQSILCARGTTTLCCTKTPPQDCARYGTPQHKSMQNQHCLKLGHQQPTSSGSTPYWAHSSSGSGSGANKQHQPLSAAKARKHMCTTAPHGMQQHATCEPSPLCHQSQLSNSQRLIL